jgi:hypothetical protein
MRDLLLVLQSVIKQLQKRRQSANGRLRSHMPLFRINNKIIFFVHVPKTGGSSIESFFSRFGRLALLTTDDHSWPKNNAQHMTASVYSRILPRSFYDYGFTIVRNPFDRIVSEYRMRCKNQGTRGRRIKEFPEWVEGIFSRYRRNQYILDNHIRPQIDFRSDGIEVFMLEHGLAKALERVSEITGVALGSDLPRVRVSEPINFKVSAACAAMVADFYRTDFEAFGYDDDPAYLLRKEGAEIVGDSTKYSRFLSYYAMKLGGGR